MSTATLVYNDGSAAMMAYDISKIFIWDNKYQTTNFENDSGGELIMPAGTLVGREASTGNLKLYDATAVDGVEFPVGMLADNYTIADATTEEVTICIGGEVAEEKVILQAPDTLDSIVALKTVRDRIAADNAGIVMRVSTENTKQDNS
jgi:hypothetical protein